MKKKQKNKTTKTKTQRNFHAIVVQCVAMKTKRPKEEEEEEEEEEGGRLMERDEIERDDTMMTVVNKNPRKLGKKKKKTR